MKASEKLLAVKLIRTIIRVLFVVLIFYVLYSGIFNRTNTISWVAIGLVIGRINHTFM